MFIISAFFILFYIFVLFLLSAFFVKRALNSYEEYTLCGRSLTIWYIILTYLGTWIGGGTIIALAGGTYAHGASQYWIFASSCLCGFFFAFLFITRIRKLHLISIADMFSLRYPHYGEIIRIPVTIGITVRNVTMIGMQFSALTLMFTFLFDIDRNLAVLVTFLIITGYTSLSGLWAVVATDVFQGILQTIGLFLLLFMTIRANKGLDNILDFYTSLGKESELLVIGGHGWFSYFLLCLFSFGIFFMMSDQGDWERVLSSNTDKTAFWGYLIPLTITLMLLLVPSYIGVFQRPLGSPHIDPGQLLYYFIFSQASPALALFIVITLVSAVMSSADSFMIATGLIFSNDIIKRFVNKNADDKELIFWTRMGVIASGTIGFAFAINIQDIIYLWITGISFATVLLIPGYIMAWFSKTANTKGVLTGMAASLAYLIILLFFEWEIDPIYTLTGLLINLLITFSVSYFSKRPDIKDVMKTYYFGPQFSFIKNIPK
ncbi:MAG: sodium:solute symporter family protein [Clostridiales bacterium]|nr:sodium:solute symporter family protein [Clostridiales bacterium]